MVGATICVALLSICWALGRGMGIATLVAAGGGEVVRASVCMEDAEATVIEAKSAHPLSLAFWY